MQHKMVDMVIVGADRVTAQGDVCNKIGTYLKALAAHDNKVPFYVAVPSPSVDFAIVEGADIPIEQRSADEVATMTGKTRDGRIETVQVVPDGSPVANFAFDVTPARLVAGLITERGVIDANRAALAETFPERAEVAAKFGTAGSGDGLRIEPAQVACRRPPVGNRTGDRARQRAPPARARLDAW